MKNSYQLHEYTDHELSLGSCLLKQDYAWDADGRSDGREVVYCSIREMSWPLSKQLVTGPYSKLE